MSVFDVVVDSEELIVLGPPNNVELSVNLGTTGKRGSRIYVGSGNPNDAGVISSSIDVEVFDLFINTSVASEYSWVYQYVETSIGSSWQEVLKLQPSIYAKNISAVFSSGTANVSIPLADIYSENTITDINRYVVQVTPIFSNPVSLSVDSKTISSGNLNITLKGVSFAPSTIALDGSVVLAVNITMV